MYSNFFNAIKADLGIDDDGTVKVASITSDPFMYEKDLENVVDRMGEKEKIAFFIATEPEESLQKVAAGVKITIDENRFNEALLGRVESLNKLAEHNIYTEEEVGVIKLAYLSIAENIDKNSLQKTASALMQLDLSYLRNQYKDYDFFDEVEVERPFVKISELSNTAGIFSNSILNDSFLNKLKNKFGDDFINDGDNGAEIYESMPLPIKEEIQRMLEEEINNSDELYESAFPEESVPEENIDMDNIINNSGDVLKGENVPEEELVQEDSDYVESGTMPPGSNGTITRVEENQLPVDGNDPKLHKPQDTTDAEGNSDVPDFKSENEVGVQNNENTPIEGDEVSEPIEQAINNIREKQEAIESEGPEMGEVPLAEEPQDQGTDQGIDQGMDQGVAQEEEGDMDMPTPEEVQAALEQGVITQEEAEEIMQFIQQQSQQQHPIQEQA